MSCKLFTKSPSLLTVLLKERWSKTMTPAMVGVTLPLTMAGMEAAVDTLT